MQFFLFLALILVLALVLFAIQNSIAATLTFVTWNFESSLTFILALAFTAGMMTGIFLFIPTWWRKVRKNRAQRKRIQELERELLNFVEQKDTPELGEVEE
jgi:uncharacterized integral membrane protein